MWVLTGDKVETARTIGFSCNLLQEGMVIHEALSKKPETLRQDFEEAMARIQEDQANFKSTKRAIVVSGDALTTIMDPNNLELCGKVL